MDNQTKTNVKNLVLSLRDDFEKEIENRLNHIGIYRDRDWKDGRSLPHLAEDELGRKELDKRRRLAAFIKREEKLGLSLEGVTSEFIKECSYTWINRLLGLKCMECQGIIDEVITTRVEFGNRSKVHRDFRETYPDIALQDDDGLTATLFSVFAEVTDEIKILFDPNNEYSLIIPRYPMLKKSIDKINTELGYETYRADDFLGWVYQYFNSREKNRVFEEVNSKKKKISGSDIINVTQLYTEKYMVHFLVENSLGAIWMEMYPDSNLSSNWEYFVKDPNNSTRESIPIKEITFLDPACGSGHFLLYAFDLYYEMYLEEGEVPKEQIPEYILKYNLHGIDIDQRAIQLTALGLYMKAKSKNPDMMVHHMNLVSADAIMQDKEILDEFLQEFEDDQTAQKLIRTIWDGLENVRELGSLIKVEEQIDAVIEQKKDERLEFYEDDTQKNWGQWKQDILDSIKRYYEKASQSFDLNKQMFANEAYKGVQLLDLLEQKYDVVATNPPYMNIRTMGNNLNKNIKKYYETSGLDLYSTFIERCLTLTKENGFSSLITQQSFMFTTNFHDFRKIILSTSSFRTLVHLGPHSFNDIKGQKVNSVMFSAKKTQNNPFIGCFIKVTDQSNKKNAIKKQILDKNYFAITSQKFKNIPDWPFVYWVENDTLDLFTKHPALDDFVEVISGAVSGDNDLFLRYFWEIKSDNKFVGYAKGGDYTKYYGNLELCILDSVKKIKEYKSGRVRAFEYRNNEKITYTLLSSKGFSARYLPINFVFDHNANSVFPKNEKFNLFYLLGWLNSSLCSHLLLILNPTISFTNNDLLRLPFKEPLYNVQQNVEILCRNCVAIQQNLLQFTPFDREFKQTGIQWGYDQLNGD